MAEPALEGTNARNHQRVEAHGLRMPPRQAIGVVGAVGEGDENKRHQKPQRRQVQGDGPQAISILEDLVRRYPNYATAWDRLGRFRGNMRQFGAAEQALRRSVELAPERGDSWLLLGLAQLELRKLDEALASLRTAARLKPTDAQTRFKIGVCLALKGDATGAAEAYREALRFQPDLVEAREALAKPRKQP